MPTKPSITRPKKIKTGKHGEEIIHLSKSPEALVIFFKDALKNSRKQNARLKYEMDARLKILKDKFKNKSELVVSFNENIAEGIIKKNKRFSSAIKGLEELKTRYKKGNTGFELIYRPEMIELFLRNYYLTQRIIKLRDKLENARTQEESYD